ncbi:hypothetical protein QQS21_005465 [Conoideocrella luteorostrata]|uniref:3-hydroxyisobutyrate dehydrogenase n=1 Tax=Conoideocrella luteorostrata TaxID=1105319 RepID=A0AAJ0FUF5_9HYPO|nr:hypothetical protein QQS21_005465 [Conoideocrella luteorostrata]
MSSTEQIGWFGLGSMGLGMALNLQKHFSACGLPPLLYSNRTLSRGDPLRDAGAIPEEHFEMVLKKSTIIFTMISNDEVLDGLVTKALAAGISLQDKIWVDTSTVHPNTCKDVSARLGKQGVAFIASPVFGTSAVAATGELIFAMAGPAPSLKRVEPYIIDVMGRKIINLGEEAHKSCLLKISGNIFVIGFQELASEGLVLAEKTGLGVDQMEEFIGDMFGTVMQSYSKRMSSGSFAPPLNQQPGFLISLAIKDVGHAITLAEEHGVTLPTVDIAMSRLKAAREFAGYHLDSSAVYGISRQEAALPFWSKNSRQGD